MTSYVTPKINTEFIFYVGLFSQANTKILQANPTLASGDVKVSIDGGSFANLTTLPTVTPASGKAVKVTLSASEMNGDNITVLFSDATGDEWCDLVISIQTSARQVDDLAYPATSGRSLTVAATGEVDANLITWQGETPNPLISGRVDVNVGANIVEEARVDGAITQGGQTTVFTTNLSDTDDDRYVGWRFVYTGIGTNNAVTRIVEGYNGTTKSITLNRALPASTTLGHAFVLWSDEVLTQAGANAAADTALVDYDAPTKAELDAAQASIESDIGGVQADTTAILEDTNVTIPAQITGLNNLSAAQVNAEVDTALADIHLDHLLANTYDPANKPGAADALLNELIGDDGGVSQFTTNSLENAPSGSGATPQQVWEYGVRTLTQSAAAAYSAIVGDRITIKRGDDNVVSLTGLGALGAWTKLHFTLKERLSDEDSEALVQIVLSNPGAGTDGLIVLNGVATGLTAANGSITVDDANGGDITVRLKQAEAALLAPMKNGVWDIQVIRSTGVTVQTLTEGRAIVEGDTTRATS